MNEPLAQQLRPQTLAEVSGQQHLLGEDKVFRKTVESGKIPNMIFYGPSGVGKTTVARIVAQNSGMLLHKLNGTSCGTSDIKAVLAEIGTLQASGGILLYLDEIQYLNKKQQQTLLECIEDGSVTLIASTTENPYFYIYNAILSRAAVFEFKSLTTEDIARGIAIAIAKIEAAQGVRVQLQADALEYLSRGAGGDMRKALGCLEFAVTAAAVQDLLCDDLQADADTDAAPVAVPVKADANADGTEVHTKAGDSPCVPTKIITLDMIQQVSRRTAMRYDKQGDDHYDIVSAFQKSMRGSDVNASLHYLARLLEAGDMVSACRRLMVCAAEDVGLAYPQILPIVKAAVDMANMLGLPEARIPLADAVILVATSPKSNKGEAAIDAALAHLRSGHTGPIPRQLQNQHYDGADAEQKGQNYKYAHNYPNSWVQQQYLPDAIKDAVYYEAGENKNEQTAKAYWDKIKNQ